MGPAFGDIAEKLYAHYEKAKVSNGFQEPLTHEQQLACMALAGYNCGCEDTKVLMQKTLRALSETILKMADKP